MKLVLPGLGRRRPPAAPAPRCQLLRRVTSRHVARVHDAGEDETAVARDRARRRRGAHGRDARAAAPPARGAPRGARAPRGPRRGPRRDAERRRPGEQPADRRSRGGTSSTVPASSIWPTGSRVFSALGAPKANALALGHEDVVSFKENRDQRAGMRELSQVTQAFAARTRR